MLPVRSPVTQIERYLPNHNGSALDGLTSNQAKRCPLCASHVELRQVICPAALPALRSRKWQFRSWADGDDKYPFALEGRDPNGAWAPHWSCAVRWRTERAKACVVSSLAGHVPCSMFRRLGLAFLAHGWQAGGPRTPFALPFWLGGIGWLLEDAEPANAVQQKPPYHGSIQDRPRQATAVCWLGQHVGTTNACALLSSPDSAGRVRENRFSGLV